MLIGQMIGLTGQLQSVWFMSDPSEQVLGKHCSFFTGVVVELAAVV